MNQRPRGLRLTLGWGGLLMLLGASQACQQSVQGQKLDINYATTTGVGSTTVASINLPHGRYTFFTYADPPNCLESVALLDHAGKAISDDATQRIATVPTDLPPGAPSIVANSLGTGRNKVLLAAPGNPAARSERRRLAGVRSLGTGRYLRSCVRPAP